MAFTNEEKKLLYWQLAVEGMDILNIPDGEYEAAQRNGKYDRFTTFVKEFSEKYKEEGILWFLEACDLNVMSIRRAIWQLDRAGWFSHVKGFLIGRPLCFGQDLMGLDQYSAVTEILKKYNVPIIMDADVGHFAPMMPLVCGSLAEITAECNDITVKMQ